MRIKQKIPWEDLTKSHGPKKTPSKKILILDAALKIAAKHGLQELSITRLSQETKLSKSLILYHFESKTKIIEQLMFYNNKMLSYFLSDIDQKETSFEIQIGKLLQAVYQWFFYNEEITELCLLTLHQTNKSVYLKKLYQEQQSLIFTKLEHIFLKSMRYKSLEEVNMAINGIHAILIGSLIQMKDKKHHQERIDSFFHLRANIETLLRVEVPALELQMNSNITLSHVPFQ